MRLNLSYPVFCIVIDNITKNNTYNIEETATWYQSLLGEATVLHREGPGWRRIRLNFPSGLACDSESEVRGWAAKLDELGFEHGPVEDVAYAWAVTARDPNNIPIEFFCAK